MGKIKGTNYEIIINKNRQGEIQVARVPKTIQKVPDQLPSEITSLSYMFTRAKSFNQDLSA
ncbi:BspA family leucine-rich repeat surface protein [Spiroplasma endosymbiont of Lariophagus distinguendus]|uniref:BspA family leucine-rich repeat surface protein n=1 Tax=Spiroplasma endosymbiont of Lariophagus distinguendus TaxID=2935082 RepID=UPI0020798EFE|nr:BspA family leucine-rich repeat surface protein [Spiroplasma endosymbiont of Lariophagus distinguendus]